MRFREMQSAPTGIPEGFGEFILLKNCRFYVPNKILSGSRKIQNFLHVKPNHDQLERKGIESAPGF